MLDGDRFTDAAETNHINEKDNDLMRANKEQYLLPAKRYHWKIVHANQPIQHVRRDIWEQMV